MAVRSGDFKGQKHSSEWYRHCGHFSGFSHGNKLTGYTMGGNALKQTTTRRYAAAEYYRAYKALEPRLTSIVRAERVALIPAYREKESFGDMDILYSGDSLTVDAVAAEFTPNQIVKNGDVISFDYNQLQIDLINTKTFDYSLAYFSYNDLGNLVGKLARRLGLKHGHTGLRLPVRYGNHFLNEILVTTCHDETLEFLGLDPAVFYRGFDTLNDIFNFVASSKYFNPAAYALENVSAAGRVRDKKRHTYTEFLKFCSSYTGDVLEMGDKSLYLGAIFDRWPHVAEQFRTITSEALLTVEAGNRLNGEVVKQITGLSGVELGRFMATVKQHELLGNSAVVMHLDHATIQQIVEELYAKYVN